MSTPTALEPTIYYLSVKVEAHHNTPTGWRFIGRYQTYKAAEKGAKTWCHDQQHAIDEVTAS